MGADPESTPRNAGLPHRRLTAVRPAGSHIRGWLIALTARFAGALTGPSGTFRGGIAYGDTPQVSTWG